jgi:hypothetical protein
MAVLATERFFDDLRKDLGDDDFDRLFAIHPSMEELRGASQAIAQMRQFRFFTSSISSGIHMSSRLISNVRSMARKRFNKIRWAIFPNSKKMQPEDISFR